MSMNMAEELFMKPENKNHEREIVSRSDAVRLEMASAVRVLGSDGSSAKEQTYLAARKTGLSSRLIERLRYRKITRVAADVADIIREAIAAHQAKQEALARHEITILTARLQALETRFRTVDEDFHCPDVAPGIEPAGRVGFVDSALADGGDE
jgi:hypothetical protein